MSTTDDKKPQQQPSTESEKETMPSGKENGGSNPLASQWIKIAAVVTLYWFVSISMVFLNKYLLSSPDLKLEAPLFITLSQCIVAVLGFAVLGILGQTLPNIITFPAFEYQPSIALKILPLSIVFVSMITFNNLTLKYLGVAFYNVGRSLTTVFNVSCTFLILRQRISLAVIGCCAIIVSGFLLGIKEEDKSVEQISIFGIVCGVLASLSVALFAILTKRVLPHVDNNIWRLQIYNNINAIGLLVPIMLLLGEVPILAHFQYWTRPYFWFIILTAGMLGIAIGYVTALQIQVTSPLTHNVSGTAKACAQTILACVVFSQSKQLLWWASNAMVLGGSSAYTYVRMLEMKANHQERKTLEIIDNERGDKKIGT